MKHWRGKTEDQSVLQEWNFHGQLWAAGDQNLEAAAWESQNVAECEETCALHVLRWAKRSRNRLLCTQSSVPGFCSQAIWSRILLSVISSRFQRIKIFIDVNSPRRRTVSILWLSRKDIHSRTGLIYHLRQSSIEIRLSKLFGLCQRRSVQSSKKMMNDINLATVHQGISS